MINLDSVAGEGNGTPLQCSCLEHTMDGGAWWAAIHGVAKSQTQLHFHFSLSCVGEGNGNPLQCSCLENPRDGGAWWAAVYGVTQSRTRLKRLSSSSSRQHSKNQRHHFADKGLYSQSYGFPSSRVRMWELDQKEGWVPQNWCFWVVVLEKIFKRPLDTRRSNQSILKEINPKH